MRDRAAATVAGRDTRPPLFEPAPRVMPSLFPPPAGMAPSTVLFSLRLQECMQPLDRLLTVSAAMPCAEMVAQLAGKTAACVIVVDDDARPVGILTDHDIARRIAFRMPPETPVAQVMSAPVVTCQATDFIYRALATTLRLNLRRLPVVDRDGRLVGVFEVHEAIDLAAHSLLQLVRRISRDGTIEELRAARQAQVDLAEKLFGEDVPATDIQQILTRLNNDIYRRVGERCLRQMAEDGWGEAPRRAVTIVMGSGGRGENYLFPDQDNGFIIADYPDADHGRIDAFFIDLAERMCRDLNELGIRYCHGYCMATNPLWRKTRRQWIEQVTSWARKSDLVAIRLADVFFDFQPVWGADDLAADLRSVVTRLMRNNRPFLNQMFRDTAEKSVALGTFGGFLTEKQDRRRRGQLDLKHAALLPMVGGVRLLALREGIDRTSTLARLGLLAEQGVLAPAEHDRLAAAFRLITHVLLKRQIEDYRAGLEVTYFVNPNSIGRRRRALLHDALRAIEGLRKRVDYEFTAQLF